MIVHRQRECNPHDKNDGFAKEMGYKHGDERDGFEMEKAEIFTSHKPFKCQGAVAEGTMVNESLALIPGSSSAKTSGSAVGSVGI